MALTFPNIPTTLTLFSFVISPLCAAEPILGFRFGVETWNAQTEGYMESIFSMPSTGDDTDGGDTGDGDTDGDTVTNTPVDIAILLPDSELAFEYFAALEHDFSLLPKLRASYTDITYESTETSDNDFTFMSTAITAGSEVTSSLQMQWADIELYYHLLDSFLRLDLGVTINNFQSTVEISTAVNPDDGGDGDGDSGDGTDGAASTSTTLRTEVEDTQYLLLTRAELELPELPISLAGKLNYYKSGETMISDLSGYVQLTLVGQSTDLQTRIGYRKRTYQHTFDSLAMDFESHGFFLHLNFAF